MTSRRNMVRQFTTVLLSPTLLVTTFAQLGIAHEEPPATPISTDVIVAKLVAANARRAEALSAYQSKRSYALEYHGFPGSRSADLAVQASYSAPDKKDFTVLSQEGSKLLVNRVLLRLLDSEKEAMQEQNRQQVELSPKNYQFTFLQMDRTPEGDAYVLQVTPRMKNKFLYKGKIWVNATDFAVARMEGEPAKNPSFWISRTRIEQRYAKFGEFWLPVHNQSVTHVRLGGDAILNIDYTDYQIRSGKTREAHGSDQVPVVPPASAVAADPH